MFFFPLAVTATIGAVGQAKLPKEIFQFIEKYIECDGRIANSQYNSNNNVSQPKESSVKCSACGNEILPGQNFCPKCGAAVSKKKFCVNCGGELEDGQVFCPKCGTKVEQ